jgi:S-adenosylmethionine:tRNA ribosyltransferase-isomerase
MRAANEPIQRPLQAKLLAIDSQGIIKHYARTEFVRLLRPGDLVIANDAATLPASLSGFHVTSGQAVEVRLAGRSLLDSREITLFSAVVFGEGDYHTRTEDRPSPPTLIAGDRLVLGPLQATVVRVLTHPRFISLRFECSPAKIMEGLARHGRVIQYSHVTDALALWDVWTSIASLPVAFEPPSAGFILDWSMLQSMRARRIGFATITHAAGISSTGDAELDAVLLPVDEPYRIPPSTALAIQEARTQGGRVVAIGTTVVRALEHAAASDGIVHAGEGLATQKITSATRLQVVDAIVSGTHEPGTSHYDLLQAFVNNDMLRRADDELNGHDYRTHEFGDSVFIESSKTRSQHQGQRFAAA